ncbi:MAG TPA: ATP-dependent protease ATPase subunit HslU [Pseudomonadota bacterium]|jgi:ATP-dependent HslUV protease ATP-binding subunit HslU|nr:ATP-dependent protease ATPase subunit HslU [Pseudomonadota bacterium]HNK44109.1 ATP-dependent protease ATPase subunit HslU [Pseudomonadota bacterium]HNN50470.1 ATP-dependent protease ATPase subunit HslU [Pseudomonadota bacterium]HNO68328.1 ATP-dependent protease ATPase subunit HslU [Pseudomonadota bacterium]
MSERREAKDLTPRAIVEELDRYIVGQRDAKRAVSIALRNRWRRQQVSGHLRDEITPKNIILIGPTGVGKTEIARRLAKLVGAPFVKVEASKFTEVGYVGRDVDSMVRDLIEVSIKLVKDEERAAVEGRAKEAAEERLLDVLLPPPTRNAGGVQTRQSPPPVEVSSDDGSHTREKLRELLRQGKLDSREVELEVSEPQSGGGVEAIAGQNIEQMGFDLSRLQDLFGGGRKKKRKVKIPEARELLTSEEAQKLIDMDKVRREAVHRAEQAGIIFIDEIDKIAGRERASGPDVSREGVQRDLLPIVEGSTVTTKYGPVKTDHILFIAAGAFHVSKPSDLIPELQGRFPIRVELQPLTQADLVRILSEPENSLCRQYQALLATEGVKLSWHSDAITEVARIATDANRMLEDIGARRLQTILERVLDELSFEAPEVGRHGDWAVEVTAEYVRQRVESVLSNPDLSKYIL